MDSKQPSYSTGRAREYRALSDIYPFTRKLQRLIDLGDNENVALNAIARKRIEVRAGSDIVSEAAPRSECTIILSGVACRYKTIAGRKRQILALLLPGDICDLHALMLPSMDHSIGALSPCRVAVIEHRAIKELTEQFPSLGRALILMCLSECTVAWQWMIGLGRRNAYERVCHLFCETKARLDVVGLCRGHSFEFPLTQAHIGDALGLSAVHVNRVLQMLRNDGVIIFERRVIQILDWDRLTAACEFNAEYIFS